MTCAECRNEFQRASNRGTQKFCSVICRNRVNARKHYAHNTIEGWRERNCDECRKPFRYKVARGKDRLVCSERCRLAKRLRLQKSQPMCVVPNCTNPRGYSNGVCNSCWYRLKRTGTLERREFKRRTRTSHGYITLTGCQAHPLGGPDGNLYEHRRVLYDAIGEGPHACHWCQAEVKWARQSGRGCPKGNLVPDHLNGHKTDNRIENLVPACNRCNSRRGLLMAWVKDHADDPVLWAMYQEALKRAG